MTLKKRVADLEQDIASERARMLRQVQRELGLPLPDDIPAKIRREAERRIVAMQSALRARPNDDEPAHRFREWVQSVHREYGGVE